MSPVAEALGLPIKDLALLRCALTLRSWANEHPGEPWSNNQRLEFLGDAVLDLVIGELLYHRYPEQDEGGLTPMRAALVSKKALAKVAREWGLGQYLFVGSGDERSGARTRSATLSDALEAVCAALYLDAQQDERNPIAEVTALVERLWDEPLKALDSGMPEDPRSSLQNAVQGQLRATPRYEYEDQGPSRIQCTITVEYLGKTLELGTARGRHRKAAGLLAAKEALLHKRWEDESE